MQNKTLAITKNCIPYFKELRTLAGSVTASILMQQLDYWFSKKEGKPFYKFKAPCENQYYKNGDSFTEELGFSIEELTNAFAKISTVYKSKTEFDNENDKFKGMFYCSYFDRKEGLTFYYRNHALLDKKLNDLFTVNGESHFTENDKVNLHKTANPISPIYITENNNKRIQQDTKEKNIKKENIICEDLSFQSLVDSVKELEPTLFAKTRNIERKIKEIDDELSKIGMPLPTYIKKPLLVACFVFARSKRITINSFLQDIKSLQDLHNNGADVQKCLQEWLVRSWTAVRYEYFTDNRGQIKSSFLVSSVLYDGRGASYGQVAKDWSGATKTQAIDPNQAFKDLCTFGSESK